MYPVTQQYYLHARFYNPVIGRFTQEDTYYGDGLNLYQYCQANPVGYVDPSGHNCEIVQNHYEQYQEYRKQHPRATAAEAYEAVTGKDPLKKDVGKSGRTTIPSQQQMQDAVTQWARMEESLANSNRQLDKFNTATVVYDARTGNYYYGMNRGVQLSGDTLNLSLESWLPESSLNQYRLGNCAEVDAVNQALNSGANASDLYLYTINTKNNVSKPMCENCIYTFGDRVADVFSH